MKPSTSFVNTSNNLTGGTSSIRHVSKLSQGPVNPHHRIFLRNEKIIQRNIAKIIAERRISVRVRDICRSSDISAPTFYLHYRNCNDALHKQEVKIKRLFREVLPEKCSREGAFTILMVFMCQHQVYFKATLKSYNLYLLTELIEIMKPYILPSDVNPKTYALYTGSLKGMFVYWYQHDRLAKDKIPYYVEQLMAMRLTYWAEQR